MHEKAMNQQTNQKITLAADQLTTRGKIKELIYSTCLFQDDLQWNSWLSLCTEDFEYAIRAYSPEIQADMTYISGNRTFMSKLTGMLPKHNSDTSPLKRHSVVYRVDIADDGKSATAVTSFTVFQTQLDGINSHIDAGESRLFLVGRYNDSFMIDGDEVKFSEREVRLDTRRLDKGSHWPI